MQPRSCVSLIGLRRNAGLSRRGEFGIYMEQNLMGLAGGRSLDTKKMLVRMF